jgi:hypothetical protein
MLNNKMNRKLNLSITPPIFCFPSHTCSCRPQAAFIVGLQCTCDILDAKDKEHCTTCHLSFFSFLCEKKWTGLECGKQSNHVHMLGDVIMKSHDDITKVIAGRYCKRKKAQS